MLDDDQTKKTVLAGSPYGVWLGLGALPQSPAELGELAAEVERLGFSALWLGGSWGSDLSVPAALLAGSSSLVVATSIANIWRDPAGPVAGSFAGLDQEYGDRFVLGVGAGHAAQTDLHHDRYARPLAALGAFLDELDAAQPPVPVHRRALAALGPKALTTAAERSAGALPYFTTPEHTRQARKIVGPGTFLAPEQKLVLVPDPDEARELARKTLKYYLALPNYVNSWRRLGFEPADLENGGSDRLIDALFGWGTAQTALDRVREHLEAGADHVCLQPIPSASSDLVSDLRVIADGLGLEPVS
jgi:probable F420-dependent oxidoreductase